MQQKKRKPEAEWKATAKEWGTSLVIALVVAFLVRNFVVEPYLVEGASMNPTLQSHERLMINRSIYYFTEPSRGEIVVFKYPRDQKRDYIKRVIAIPGDTVEIREGDVYLNGQILKENYILEKAKADFPKVIVPPKHIFVLGDNRNNSEDSRYKNVGFVP